MPRNAPPPLIAALPSTAGRPLAPHVVAATSGPQAKTAPVPAGSRPLAAHVQAAVAGAQPKMPGPPVRRAAAPHVVAAVSGPQAKAAPVPAGSRPLARHVQAAVSGAQPKLPGLPAARAVAPHVRAAIQSVRPAARGGCLQPMALPGPNPQEELGSVHDVATDLDRYYHIAERIDTSSLDAPSGEKTAFTVLEDPELALVVKRHKMPHSDPLIDELSNLLILEAIGFPVVEVKEVGTFTLKSTSLPAVIMKRYEGSSKMLAKSTKGGGKLTENVAEVAQNLDKRQALESLTHINHLLQTSGYAIADLQFLIDDRSQFFVNDPNGILTAKDEEYAKVYMSNLSLLEALMTAVRTFAPEVEETPSSSDDDEAESFEECLARLSVRVDEANKAKAPKLTKAVRKEFQEAFHEFTKAEEIEMLTKLLLSLG